MNVLGNTLPHVEEGTSPTTTTPSPSPTEDPVLAATEATPVEIPPPEPRPSRPTLDNLTWDQVDVDSGDNVVGVFGIRLSLLSSKQLRSICSRLEVRGVKNVKKQVMIDNINNHYKNRKAYDLMDAGPVAAGGTNLAIAILYLFYSG